MKRSFYYFAIPLILFTQAIAAQSTSSILESEHIFSKTAQKEGIKRAFEKYMAPQGYIVVGNKIVNALAYYSRLPIDTTDLLWWQPTYVFTNTEGDFGFATGPFRYFNERNGHATAAGQTFSIWERGKDGTFKILFDGGVNSASVPNDSIHDLAQVPVMEFILHSSPSPQTETNPRLDFPLEYKIHKEAIFLRPNRTEVIRAKEAKVVPKMMKKLWQEGFDRNRGIFYRFGNLGKDETSLQQGKFCGYFVQVWSRCENDWLLVADVMQY